MFQILNERHSKRRYRKVGEVCGKTGRETFWPPSHWASPFLKKNIAKHQINYFLEVLSSKLKFISQITQLRESSLHTAWPFRPSLCPQQPACFVDSYGLQKDGVRGTSLHGRGIPNAYHSCTQHYTTGQPCSNSTDHYDPLAKHAHCEAVKKRYVAANMMFKQTHAWVNSVHAHSQKHKRVFCRTGQTLLTCFSS